MARLMQQAARHGGSAEAEAREILEQTLSGKTEIDFGRLAAEFRAVTAERRHPPAEQPTPQSRDE